jgi:hypothetical protein
MLCIDCNSMLHSPLETSSCPARQELSAFMEPEGSLCYSFRNSTPQP